MYTIKINYQTGGSFSTEDTENIIGCAWESKKLARKGLQAIKDHYSIYKSRSFSDKRSYKEKDKEASKFDWYDKDYSEYNLLLEIDDGTKQEISAFWLGYFEHLYSAEIVYEGDTEDKFTT